MSTLIYRSVTLLNKCPSQILRKVRYMNTSRVLRQVSEETGLPKKKDGQYKAGFITWRSLVVTGIGGGAFLLFLYNLKEERNLKLEREKRRELGKASIGGKFELVNSEGKIVKSDDFLGQWVMIYFGFTHCPDVCPDELEKLTAVVKKLGTEYDLKVQPIFISVDPDRDTPQIVGKYVREFSDNIIGLTGTTEQVAQACKSYRVYFSSGPKDQDSDYIVDHTIIIYLVDPEGQFVDYYGLTHNVEQIVSSVYLNKLKFDKLTEGA